MKCLDCDCKEGCHDYEVGSALGDADENDACAPAVALAELWPKLNRLRLIKKMASDVMATDSRDWSKNRTDAWLWALLVGWDEAAGEEVEQAHGAAFYGACSLGRDALEDDKR